MKETVTSVRWIFGILGVLYLASLTATVLLLQHAHLLGSLFSEGTVVSAVIADALFAGAYLYIASAFTRVLSRHSRWIYVSIWTPIAFTIIFDGMQVASLTLVVYISLLAKTLVAWYLHRQIARLARTAY